VTAGPARANSDQGPVARGGASGGTGRGAALTRRMVSTGSRFEGEFAYARAVCQGDWCFVAGTTGYDYKSMEMPEAAVDQARNALATIESSLSEAGFAMADVVRATYYIRDAGLAGEIGPALREAFGTVRPAATMLVAGLIAPEIKIEIEVTALRRPARDAR